MSVYKSYEAGDKVNSEAEKFYDHLSYEELKKAYAALAEKENALQRKHNQQQQLLAKYTSLIEDSPKAFFLTNADGKILDANKSAIEIFGHPLEDLKSLGRQGIIDHDETDMATYLKAREQWGKVHGEVTGIHKNGTRFPCVFFSFILSDNNGGFLHSTIVEEIYEKKETATEKVNSERRFKQLIENGDDVIIEIDKDRIVKYVSPSVKRIMGYEPSEMLGRRLKEFAYHADAKLLSSVFEEVLQNPGKTFYRQYRIKHKTKDFIWVAGSAISLFHIHGIESLIINQRDISIEKQALELITQSEKRYRYLFNNNPLPLFIFHLKNLQILECNDACLRKYCYTRNEFLALTIKDLRIKEEGDVVLKQIEDEISANNYYEKTVQHRKKNGELMHIHFTGYKILFRGVAALLVHADDITEKVFAYDLLKQSYERLETAQEIAHLGYWEFDVLSGKIFWSKEIYKIFGLAEDEFAGDYQSFFERIHPDDQKAFQKDQEAAMKGERKLDFQYRIIRPDGSIRIVVDKGELVYDAEKKPLKLEGMIQDITEQKTQEQERERLIRELTVTVKDLQQFSYITSHNLRTPLANLIGLLNIVDGIKIEDDLLAQIISGFKTSAISLNETVNDLVKVLFVKENPSLQQDAIVMEDLFEKVIMQTKSLIAESQPEIHYDFSAVPVITFSKVYMESILLNLLTNAIKYKSPLRRLKVYVTTEDTGEKILLRFSDNGLGIDTEKHKSRLFGFYQRFHDHPDSKGMGLYLVKSQLEALGGSIDIKSEVNIGTEFRLTFKKLQMNTNYTG